MQRFFIRFFLDNKSQSNIINLCCYSFTCSISSSRSNKRLPIKSTSNNKSIHANHRLIHRAHYLSSFSTKMPKYEYPKVRRDESIVDSYHGIEVKK